MSPERGPAMAANDTRKGMPSGTKETLWRLVKREPCLPPLFWNHTYKQFVVRPGNTYAFEAAKLITSRHGKPELALFPNCLFLHGKPGVGKTHLMVAVAQAIEQDHPETRTKYCSVSEFVRDEFRESLAADEFLLKKRHENVDLLLLENPESINHMVRTRQRLYSFFDWYLSARKTLVLTSALPPMKTEGPRNDFSTWFESAVKAEVHPLDRKGRAIVIRKWLDETNSQSLPSISEAGIQVLASQEVHDLRELSGLLTRILMEAGLTMRTISAEQARAVLTELSSSRRSF